MLKLCYVLPIVPFSLPLHLADYRICHFKETKIDKILKINVQGSVLL